MDHIETENRGCRSKVIVKAKPELWWNWKLQTCHRKKKDVMGRVGRSPQRSQ